VDHGLGRHVRSCSGDFGLDLYLSIALCFFIIILYFIMTSCVVVEIVFHTRTVTICELADIVDFA